MKKSKLLEELVNISDNIDLIIFRLNNDQISEYNDNLINAQKHLLTAIEMLDKEDE